MDDQEHYRNGINNDNRRTNRLSGNNSWQEPKPDAKAEPPVPVKNTDPEIQQDPTQPQYSEGFTVITPIETRRRKLQSMAQKEEEDYLKWKEENRPGPIQLAPSKLGGEVSLAEVRQRQQVELRQSKLQKKLRKEEMDQQQRKSEEEENERIKAKQREKAERLEERRIQEERQRREVLQQDHLRRTEHFLQRVERSETAPVASTLPLRASPWAKSQEYREGRKEEENAELQLKKEKQRMMVKYICFSDYITGEKRMWSITSFIPIQQTNRLL
ncbi:epithelial-stromal interaction protein 1 [Esox lucius]|uniref:epithelial-stromal interaction protein 1 n=1 Tax=Esox lucius TaxID=8010 RepID=UPI00147718D4|nr:epithelial-stromal interaction protein 1 [Esox lucius]